MKIGIIREWKKPEDKRVALTPSLCKKLQETYPDVELAVEASPVRCFKDAAYKKVGVQVQKDMSDCDVLLGVKEVPNEKLIPGKIYMFFSHTIKAQDYNRPLLQEILDKKIRLIDYETLVWPKDGQRILGFGKWAGIVGVYNAFLTWGKKTGLYDLPPAYEVNGYEELLELLKGIDVGTPRIVFTGNGRVAQGIREVLENIRMDELMPSDFIMQPHKAPVFTQLTNWDLYHRKDGGEWSDEHFYNNHEMYCCEFYQFGSGADILINGMYWEDDMPPLFTKEVTTREDFRIQVIADITCDVEGSVPITMEATDIHNPTFGWSRKEQKQVAAYGEDTIDVMAVTNLPTEMPKDASEEFGSKLLEHIIPLIIKRDKDGILSKASITNKKGNLTKHYSYLQDFVDGK
jgi:saccharopine dehydrogenase (NAD+, L-lysine-forming)